jgi:fatty acid amide hydrolase
MAAFALVSELHPLGAAEMAGRIARGEIYSRDIVESLLRRIEAVNPHLSAIVQPAFDQARQEADRADAAVRSGQPLGPLHGVPVTIKDCFAVAGMETTLGIPGFSPGVDAADSPLVARLRAAGAIVLGKTNVPEGMLLHECDNPLFGRSLHPQSDQRSPGGSSGGEAIAVATHMSPLGLGSDLGGSTRQPAHSCGVFGLKPTSGRLTIHGSQRAMPGMQALTIQPGPIARCVADLDLAMRVLLDDTAAAKQPDERSEPWPNYREVNPGKLRVAYWTDNGIAAPCAAIARAVEDSAAQLGRLGAEVRQVTAPETDEMLRIYFGLISADGMRSLGRLLKGRQQDPQLRRQVRLGKLPRWLRAPLSVILPLFGQPALGKLVRWTGPRSADAYWQLTLEAEQYRQRFWRTLDAAFDGQPVDAVLTPPHSLPALKHGTALHLLLEASHCYLANLLDAPAGVAPCKPVTDAEERQELAQQPGRWSLEARLRRQNASDSAGLPVGVQVMARPWRDDIALAVMGALGKQESVTITP